MGDSKLESIKHAICPLPWISASFNTDSSLRVCCNTDHGGAIKNGDQKIYLRDLSSAAEIQQTETIQKAASAYRPGGFLMP